MAGLCRVRITIEAHWIDLPGHGLLRIFEWSSRLILDSVRKTSLLPQLHNASHFAGFLRSMSDKLVDKSKILLCPIPKDIVI
jgi:hypothetical protein